MKAWSTRLRWMAVLLVLLWAPWSQAAHERQIFVVNAQAPADEDEDGDHDFRSLTAAFDPENVPHVTHDDTVLLKPGSYEETLTIGVAGVTLRGEGGSTQTRLIGSLSIQAKNVKLQGVHIDAAGHAQGLRVDAQRVQIQDVTVSNAEDAGIQLQDADFAALNVVQSDNNAGAGIVVRDSDNVVVSRSQFQANGQAGARLMNLRGGQVTDSRFALNRAEGLALEDVSYSQFFQNDFSANASHGAWLYDSDHNDFADSAFSHNGGFGLSLESTSQTHVLRSEFESNGGGPPPSGGILIGAASHENTVQESDIHGHSDAQGAGLYLLGSASANAVVQNVFAGNQVGVRLAQDASGLPQTNRVEDNRIEGSLGEGIASGGSNNRYVRNTVVGNNGAGMAFTETEGEYLEGNVITDNSTAGLYAAASRQLKAVGNVLSRNAQGVVAYELSESQFSDNQVHDNFGRGGQFVGGGALKLLNNAFLANQQEGAWLEGVRQMTVSGNAFASNAQAGVHLTRAEQAELYDNRFQDNGTGLRLLDANGVEAQFNQFDHNHQLGLQATGSQALDVRYNYWGSSQGPAGVAPTTASGNDAVEGVGLEQAFPWLPALPGALEQRTVKGWYFTQRPQPQWVHAPQAGVSLQWLDVEASGGWLTVFQTLDRPENAPTLGVELARFSLSTGGRLEGTVNVMVPYDPQALTAEMAVADLRLFAWNGIVWQELPGTLDLDSHSVSASLSVSAPQEVTVVLAWPQQRALTSASWIVGKPVWIAGEPLNARLSDPDKDLNPQKADRLAGAIVATAQDGQRWTLDAVETAPSSGLFTPQWLASSPSPAETVVLRYEDPEAPQDTCEIELAVRERQAFVLDPNADEGEDSNYDFRFRTLEAALAGEPSLQPGETLRLLPGEYRGDWVLVTPQVIVAAEPGARLRGTLTVKADEVTVRGLELDSGRAPAIRIEGDRVALEAVKVLSAGATALRVSGRGFSLKNSRVESAGIAVELQGEHSTIVSNTIIGTPALVNHGALAATHNWWGRPGGPGEDVQGVAQEDIFPWLLAPPQNLLEAAHVKGAAWNHPSARQILSDVGQALLEADFARAWKGLFKLFGQEGSVFPFSSEWSLHVRAAGQGRLIISDGVRPAWLEGQAQAYALWLEPGQAAVALEFEGAQRPRAWLAQGQEWVELTAQRHGKAGWRVRLGRLALQDPMPLWFAVSAP